MGEPLEWSGQRPRVGGGGDAAEADNDGSRCGGSSGRQEPGQQGAPVTLRPGDRSGHAELVSERNQRRSFTR